MRTVLILLVVCLEIHGELDFTRGIRNRYRFMNDNKKIKAQFEYENACRKRILDSAPGAERSAAFSAAYNGLVAGITNGQFAESDADDVTKASQKFSLVYRFLNSESRVAEFGPGDGDLAVLVANRVTSVALVDVLESWPYKLPKKCRYSHGDGVHLPGDVGPLDLVIGSHVLEHLHPETVPDHLLSVRNALSPHGRYIIFTPNRFAGPHDISAGLSDEASGLHLKEYEVRDMYKLLKDAGFRRSVWYAGGRGMYLRIPFCLIACTELLLSVLPRHVSRRLVNFFPIRALLGIIVVGKV
ncbi:hypothetical protein A2480_02935 [Candidatus Uhrbacteria bacterium RIFOXYC2_FULL_47_19]|uniref:Methyltransferase type 11 domain-containing protein n=1 Tax=Candidatus Uhrbacteria bacterium RIFOXYC2_FULL_47_19 TaxID=1802424 RepID=A0A1F7WFE0_9BACT|nr:MAG: hypothetical protein A2480_02935 [Candidatus Uhrbacteria bacterium RIFOXYC2_FULL_47_19]